MLIMKLIKKYWFLLFLLFLVVILLILKIKYSNRTQTSEITNYTKDSNIVEKNNKSETVTTEPEDQLSNSPTPTKEITVINNTSNENYFTTDDGETINANDYRKDSLTEEVDVDSLEVLLPYSGKYFTATELSDNGYLEIRIKNEEDFDKAQEELGKWLEDNNTNFDETICVYYFE